MHYNSDRVALLEQDWGRWASVFVVCGLVFLVGCVCLLRLSAVHVAVTHLKFISVVPVATMSVCGSAIFQLHFHGIGQFFNSSATSMRTLCA